jgi:peptidoglycan/xylan/chitin deacetylase (PgdA/CDA1 family)
MIKAFMYHDIRDNKNPNFENRYNLKSFLNIDLFKNHLKYLKKNFNIIDSNEIQNAITSRHNHALLTFDDGLLDHYHIGEILSDMKINGTFFIPTQSVKDRVVMRSHKIQFILSCSDEKNLTKKIIGLTNQNLWGEYSVSKWKNNWWSPEMVFVTNILRYIDDGTITEQLFSEIVSNDEVGFCNELYLNEPQIKALVAAGHKIGGHGFTSHILPELPCQESDIKKSLDYISKFTTDPTLFSYPNGKYDQETLKILRKYNCKFSYTVVKENITRETSMLEIPRYDGPQDIIV